MKEFPKENDRPERARCWPPPNRARVSGAFVLVAILAAFVYSPKHVNAQSTDQGAKSAPAATGNAENGKKLFSKYGCYECHGYQGQGSPATGARIGPNPIPLASLIAYVRKPAGDMPPYSAKQVSDQELTDIHAYLRSVPRPPDVKTIPLLQ